MTVPGADGCDFLVDDGGAATLLIQMDCSLPEPSSTANAEFKVILQLLKDSIPVDKTKYTRMAKQCKGVSEVGSGRWLPKASSFSLQST